MKKLIYLIVLFYTLNCFAIAYAKSNNYEVELAPLFREYCKIIKDEKTTNEFEKNSNTYIAIDLLNDVLHNYPGTLTLYKMIDYIGHVKFWENDKKLKEKYLLIKEKYINTLNDPNNDISDKMLFIILANHVDYIYTNNEEESKKILKLCVECLKKIKDECSNIDYQAIALYCLLSTSTTYNNEILDKFSDHPIRLIAEKNAITYKYYYESNYDRHLLIEELKKFGEEHKAVIIPGGWKYEIENYDNIFWNYGIYLKEYENAKKYLNLIEEKAPDYYRLTELKKLLENSKKEAYSDK